VLIVLFWPVLTKVMKTPAPTGVTVFDTAMYQSMCLLSAVSMIFAFFTSCKVS
jgi:hypothetical protein